MSRPEHTAPPEVFYNDIEAKKYTQNSRMIQIQRTMTERAIELLALPEGASLLLCDIGCGSGLSGEVLEEAGHGWVGCDISTSMLGVAVSRDNAGATMSLPPPQAAAGSLSSQPQSHSPAEPPARADR